AFHQQTQAVNDVADLAFGEEDDASVHDDVGVRSVEAEQVGEVWDGDPEVGARIAVPLGVQVRALPADDRHRHQEVRRGESGPVHDHVRVVKYPAFGDDAPGRDALDGVGDQLDVLPLERPCPDAVVSHDPFARRWVGGHDL